MNLHNIYDRPLLPVRKQKHVPDTTKTSNLASIITFNYSKTDQTELVICREAKTID